MNISLTNIFTGLRKLLIPSEPESAEEWIERAEFKAEDVLDMVDYLKGVNREEGLFSSLALDGAVENAQGYLQYISETAFKIGHGLQDFHVENAEYFERLKEVERTFNNGASYCARFIKLNSKSTAIPDVSVQLGYLSNVIKMFEPDMRPRADVVPIREGIDIDR